MCLAGFRGRSRAFPCFRPKVFFTRLPSRHAPHEPPADQVEAAALRLCEAMAGDEFGWACADGERLILVDVAMGGPGLEQSPFNRELAAAYHHASCWLLRADLVILEMIPPHQVKRGHEKTGRDGDSSTAPLTCLKSTPELWTRRRAGTIFHRTPAEKIGTRRDGRPKFGKGANAKEKALRNVYELIRAAKKKGWGPQRLLNHFSEDKDFRARVKEAGQQWGKDLFKNAIAWIRDNSDQKTQSGNVS